MKKAVEPRVGDPAVACVGTTVKVICEELFSYATHTIVAAAPCALVISIPITLVAALGTAARKGVLIKGGVNVEELAKVTVVALDKTGTITMGMPEVTDLLPIGGGGGSTAVAIEEALAIFGRRRSRTFARSPEPGRPPV